MKNTIKIVLILIFICLLSQCYLTKQGYHLLTHQYHAKKIEEVLKDPHLPEKERKMLIQIKNIKKFGTEKLGLIENDNYTTYVRTSRNYLLDIVSASAKDKFDDYTWWFPFFGSFPYKGFYDRSDAEDEARWLKQFNLDVLIRKSDAYSTLGFFNDPLYSYMSEYSLYHLSGLIFHEMTHATLYIKSEMQFNENLASFVEREGALLYVKETLGENSQEYLDAIKDLKDSESFMNQMKLLAQRLNVLYQSNVSYDEKLAKRQQLFDNFKKEYMENYSKNFISNRYKYIEKLSLNNAYIRLFLLYEENLSQFYDYFQLNGKDLKKMLKNLQQIRSSGEKPFQWLNKALH